MNLIQSKPYLTDEQIKELHGNYLDESYLKYPVINSDTIVKDENGNIVLVFL